MSAGSPPDDAVPYDADQATDALDAALYTGDAFYSATAVRHLRQMMARWERRCKEIESELGVALEGELQRDQGPLVRYYYGTSNAPCCEGEARIRGSDAPAPVCEHGNLLIWRRS